MVASLSPLLLLEPIVWKYEHDGRQIRGAGKCDGIIKNAFQYKLESYLLDTVVFDITRHPWTDKLLFDAIITDPPYGLRAGAKRISSGKGTISPDLL